MGLSGTNGAPDYVDHNAEAAGRGPGVIRVRVEAMRATFNDFSLTIENMIAEDDRVVARVTGRGVHRGVWHTGAWHTGAWHTGAGAWMGIAPTGAKARVRGVSIDRHVDGRLSSIVVRRTPSACRGRWALTRSPDA